MLSAISKEDILLKAACEEFPCYMVDRHRIGEFFQSMTTAAPLTEAMINRIYRHYCQWHQDKAFRRFSAMIREEAPRTAFAI